jgi:hypothetical protein
MRMSCIPFWNILKRYVDIDDIVGTTQVSSTNSRMISSKVWDLTAKDRTKFSIEL